jgi:hypothetical protein
MNAIRKVPNQSQPVSGRKISADDDDDDDNEVTNTVSQSQADKGNTIEFLIKIKLYFFNRKHSIINDN